MDITSLFAQFAALAGVGALIAALVNIGKKVGLVKDGDAITWATGLNIVGIAILFAVRVFAPQVDVGNADAVANNIAQILVLVVGVVAQLGFTRGSNEILKGVPVVGYSHSLEIEKKAEEVKAISVKKL